MSRSSASTPACRSSRPAGSTPRWSRRSRAEKAVYVAIHANHPRELTAGARPPARRLVGAGIPCWPDGAAERASTTTRQTLEALFRGLVAMRVKPYYLHHADLAPGTARFRTGLAEGQALMRALRGRCLGTLPADLCAGPAGRARQGAGRAVLCRSGSRRRLRGGRRATGGVMPIRHTPWDNVAQFRARLCGAADLSIVSSVTAC